ncbi:8778_t:CDS:2 [Funneliformis mosseae]|uniref:8778_t:CDS:1 n=1 Tax=Funneliformis mosseae TaxID=27381 RepID=A0A9N9F151_FUNMO|nr:8778_t:CDS:2 [Funneliformis mosseae]
MQNHASSSTSTISYDKSNVFKGLKRQPVEDQDIYSHDSPHPSSSTSTISNDTVTDDIRLLDISGDDVETIDKVPIKMEKIENVNDPIIIIDDDDVEMMGENVETIDNIPIKTEKIEMNIKLENIPIKMETPSIGPCHHPKHVEYEELGLTKNSFVRITKNLAKVVGIDRGLMICRGCVKQTHHDTEYTSHQDYISPKKARKDKMLKNLKIDMFGFGTNNIPSRRKWIIID